MLATTPINIAGTPAIVLPAGHELTMLEGHRDRPIRIKQNTTHHTAESFVDYYNKFVEPNSVIFIDKQTDTFTAILDYHDDRPAYISHRATFSLKKTNEWESWLRNDKQPMTQDNFGRFIEDNLEEIIEPSGADMLEIALSIQAKTTVNFSSAQRLDNGQVQLTYVEDINGTAGAKGQLKIPQTFTIGLKLFEGGEPYRIEARLRYRIKDGNLSLWYELIRAHKTIDANIADTTLMISSKILSGKIYHGSAPA